MSEHIDQPEIRWMPIFDILGNKIGARAAHDGPCVFVDHQCSCGLLDIGIVRGGDEVLTERND